MVIWLIVTLLTGKCVTVTYVTFHLSPGPKSCSYLYPRHILITLSTVSLCLLHSRDHCHVVSRGVTCSHAVSRGVTLCHVAAAGNCLPRDSPGSGSGGIDCERLRHLSAVWVNTRHVRRKHVLCGRLITHTTHHNHTAQSQHNPGWPDLDPKWVRLAPNGTNPWLFQIRLQYILAK